VRPGLHRFSSGAAAGGGGSTVYSVVWWDPKTLELGIKPSFGRRYEQLIGKDVEPAVVENDRQAYENWRASREEAVRSGSAPSVIIRTATEQAAIEVTDAEPAGAGGQPSLFARELGDLDVDVIELARDTGRPAGARYGALLHALFASVPLDGTREQIEAVAELQARVLGATITETASAAAVAQAALAHPLLRRAAHAERSGSCRREVPITLRQSDGSLVEGIVDLAFRDVDGWTVVDFKSDRELTEAFGVYRRQVGIYARAIAEATGGPVRAVLMRV
jgi:ATP-dependent exoDNAse (exonuclease V) beta subunit